MNKPNNKRRRNSQTKIEKAFVTLIQDKEINQIHVTEIIKIAKVNRSTFYANYMDIYDLADKISHNVINEVKKLYHEEIKNQYNSNDYLKLFKHIKNNQLFYKTLFKLGVENKISNLLYDNYLAQTMYQDKFIDYHITFFKAGLNAIIKKWLNNNCQESPEEIFSILKSEYEKKVNKK